MMKPSNGRMMAATVPSGRCSLAEALGRLASQANSLCFEFRWLASGVDLSSPEGRASTGFHESLEALESARDSLVTFAMDVKLGRIDLAPLEEPDPPASLFDLFEQNGPMAIEIQPDAPPLPAWVEKAPNGAIVREPVISAPPVLPILDDLVADPPTADVEPAAPPLAMWDVTLYGASPSRALVDWVARIEAPTGAEAVRIAGVFLERRAPWARIASRLVASPRNSLHDAKVEALGGVGPYFASGGGLPDFSATAAMIGVSSFLDLIDPKRLAELATPDPVVNREPGSKPLPLRPFDVKTVGGRHGTLGVWVARIHAEGFASAEELAGAILGHEFGPSKYCATVALFHNDDLVAKAGGFCNWHASDGRLVNAAVTADWREILGLPPKPPGEAHDSIRHLGTATNDAPDPTDGFVFGLGATSDPATSADDVVPLDTDEMLMSAAYRRNGMVERWAAMRLDGASDLEVRATLSRAFDLGLCDMNGFKAQGGFIEEPFGSCSFQSGESPKFWGGSARWEGRPTLEGKRLVERARAVFEIPETAGGPVPKRQGKARRPKPKPKRE